MVKSLVPPGLQELVIMGHNRGHLTLDSRKVSDHKVTCYHHLVFPDVASVHICQTPDPSGCVFPHLDDPRHREEITVKGKKKSVGCKQLERQKTVREIN